MKTVTITFKSNGDTVKKVAVIKDDLSDLSGSKKNQADTIEEYAEDGFWALYFGLEDSVEYEIQFAIEDYCRTLTPIKAITWVDDVIDDVQPIDSLTIK